MSADMTTFFRLVADPKVFPRWYLKAPIDEAGNELDARLFSRGGAHSTSASLRIPLRRDGPAVDVNFGDFNMIVTPASLNAEMVPRFGLPVQRIPVEIETGNRDFEILNILDVVTCIDEKNSEFMKWTEQDGRPDKTGALRMITRLRIDPCAAQGHHLFRIQEWPVALIASNALKEFLEQAAVTGIQFQPVS
jgi:hypothetical protein